ncbi:MAG: small ribosomal subunit biogenesis GTPase RsgA [Chromatocurvus sp.]
MTKRRLTRQQAWRIEKIRAERARRAARVPDSRGLAEAGPAPSGGLDTTAEREGLIVAHYGTQVDVEAVDRDGALPGQTARCHLRANLDGLVTGDRVVFCAGTPTGVVVAQLPRSSELCRPDAYGRLKAVAANIDQIAIVIAPLPTPHANLLDRYLVAVQATGASPLIVVNKCDLLVDAALATAMAKLLEIYPSLGYPVLHCSTQHGLAELETVLRGRTSIFVGQSGVGKTSLLNALLPGAGQRTGALSEGSGKGTHTTTTATLFHLTGGGRLIDSPGIREFGLEHLTRHAVESGFREFHPYLGHCRFRDCRHRREPGCALLQAVDSGAITAQRLASYRHIIGSLDAA